MFLEISQNSQENTCARVSFLVKLQAQATLLKRRLRHSVNFEKFLRTPFFTEHVWAAASGSLTMIKDGKLSVGKETICM